MAWSGCGCVFPGVGPKQRHCKTRWIRISSWRVRSPLTLRQRVHGDHPGAAWAAWSGTVAPHAAHFLFNARAACHRPALPEPAFVPGPAPTVPQVPGDAAQRPPGAGALPYSPLGAGARPSARRTQPAATRQPNCDESSPLHLLFPLCPPSRPKRRPSGSQAPCRFILRPRVMHFSTKCLGPPLLSRHRHEKAVFQIAVVNCTCLADYLWESVGGAERWKMLLRFAEGGKLYHPARDFCHA